MYCRNCNYDLRGQKSSRCSECGTQFSSDDKTTFFLEIPGSFGKLLLWLRCRKKILIVVMTVLWLFYNFKAYEDYNYRCGGISYGIVACKNLKDVITVRKFQAYKHPEIINFDVEAAKAHIQPSFSPWSERDAIGHRIFLSKKLRYVPTFVLPAILCLVIIAALYEKRIRKGAIVLAFTLFLIVLGSLFPDEVVTKVYPGSYAFLDDIVHIPDIDLKVSDENTIIAYDSESFRWNGQRVVAFADGHAVHRRGDWAKPLFKAQGIPYPPPFDSR